MKLANVLTLKYAFLTLILFGMTGCERKIEIKSENHPTEIGRFEIHSGTFENNLLNLSEQRSTDTKTPIIIKLDNQTGKTWKYHQTGLITSNSITLSEGWMEITNSKTNMPLPRFSK